uniref:Uncharacterized protein n=1 Tax=Psilocybe cubensis TaxID=181762 RepID=A0A8H7XY45_PSICU
MEAGISDEDYMKINDSNSNTGELERPDTPIYIDQPKKKVEAQPQSPRPKPGPIPKKRQWGIS